MNWFTYSLTSKKSSLPFPDCCVILDLLWHAIHSQNLLVYSAQLIGIQYPLCPNVTDHCIQDFLTLLALCPRINL